MAHNATLQPAAAQPQQLAEIKRLNFDYVEVASFDLRKLSDQRRVQVRDVKNYAHKDEYEAFANQMTEVAFPPIVVTRDDFLIDGNTRIAAVKLRKENFFPAIVLQVDYASADEKTRGVLVGLAATLNNLNGRRQTAKEVNATVQKLVTLGWHADEIVRATGAKSSMITNIGHEVIAHNRLARVGIENGQVRATGTSLRALGKPAMQVLNDEPYREIASLAMDAGLNANEISKLAKDAKETGSDSSALNLIARERQENAERIRRYRVERVVPKPSPSRQLRQRLGFIQKFLEDPTLLVEKAPEEMELHRLAVSQSIAILTKVGELQETSIAEAGHASA
jgi:disulfide oxidoreductase YuzD